MFCDHCGDHCGCIFDPFARESVFHVLLLHHLVLTSSFPGLNQAAHFNFSSYVGSHFLCITTSFIKNSPAFSFHRNGDLLLLCNLVLFCVFVCFVLSFCHLLGHSSGIWRFPGKGQIGAVAASLSQSHSNSGFKPRLQPTPELMVILDP